MKTPHRVAICAPQCDVPAQIGSGNIPTLTVETLLAYEKSYFIELRCGIFLSRLLGQKSFPVVVHSRSGFSAWSEILPGRVLLVPLADLLC